MRVRKTAGVQFVAALGLATLVSVCLLVAESVQSGDFMHAFLLWNVILAWVPFGLAVWLVWTLRQHRWSDWSALLITAAWVAFLPNSFYIISDFIHLSEVGTDALLLSAVTLTAFVLTGLCLGIGSLYMVHMEILKRVTTRSSAVLIGALLFLSSGAIYIGRDLRWNSWDVLLNPFGLLFDTSDRLLHPSQYPQALGVILPFFVLLATLYWVVWSALAAAPHARK